MPIHHNLKLQNHALAIRQELGFPLTPMANESVKFTAGGEIDVMRRIELARLAEVDLSQVCWILTCNDAAA